MGTRNDVIVIGMTKWSSIDIYPSVIPPPISLFSLPRFCYLGVVALIGSSGSSWLISRVEVEFALCIGLNWF